MASDTGCCDCGKKCTGKQCRACYLEQHRSPPATCLKCGKEFRRNSTRNYKADRPKYCSRNCSFAALRDGERTTGRAKVCLPKLTRQLIEWFDGWEKSADIKIIKVVQCTRKGCVATFPERSRKGKRRRYCSVKCWNSDAHPPQPLVRGKCRQCNKDVVAKRKSVYCKSCLRKRSRGGRKTRKRCQRFGTFFNAQVRSLDVFRRDGWRCQLCLKKVSVRVPVNHPLRATIDHIKPISLGGDHDWINVQCACRKCNVRKSNKRVGQARMF